jgi:hypothetical protein
MTVKELFLCCELQLVEVSGGGYDPTGDFSLDGLPLVSNITHHCFAAVV